MSGAGIESPRRVVTVVPTIWFTTVVMIGALYPSFPSPGALSETGFSAARAMDDLVAFANAPRPSGSAANDHARAFLAGRLAELGLDVEIQTTSDEWINVIATRKGTSDSRGILLLAAHYDTVPSSPGAADDGMGVVALLEIARLLMEESVTRNDLVLLFTDGEERGMRGARGFVREHHLASSVSAVINLEAAGGEGPAVLFDAGPESGHIIRAFETAPPFADSFSEWIFAALPNNTDYAAFREAGIPGVNLATVAGSQVYHATFDRVDRIDARSLQHLGDVTLAATRTLLDQDLQLRESDRAYRDLFGQVLLVWPAAWNRAVAFVLFGLLLWRCGGSGLRSGLRQIRTVSFEVFVTAALVWIVPAAVLALVCVTGGDGVRSMVRPVGDASAASWAILGQLLLVLAISPRSPERAQGWIGLGLVVVAATAIGFPEATHFSLVPVLTLLAGVFPAWGAIERKWPRPVVWIRQALVGVAVLAIVPLAYRVGLLAHVRAPVGLLVGGVAATLVCGVGSPLVAGWGRPLRAAAGLCGFLALVGWALQS